MITPDSGIASFHEPNRNKLMVPVRLSANGDVAVMFEEEQRDEPIENDRGKRRPGS